MGILFFLLFTTSSARDFSTMLELQEFVNSKDKSSDALLDYNKSKHTVTAIWHDLNHDTEKIYTISFDVLNGEKLIERNNTITSYEDYPFVKLFIYEPDSRFSKKKHIYFEKDGESVEAIINSKLDNNKTIILYAKNFRLHYVLYDKDWNIDFYYPKGTDRSIDFIYDSSKEELFFSYDGIKYSIYYKCMVCREHQKGKHENIGLKVTDKNTTRYYIGENVSFDERFKKLNSLKLSNLLNENKIDNRLKKKIYTSFAYAKRHPFDIYKLKLSSQYLKTLPNGISKLENLKWLYLDDNNLRKLDDTLCQLKKLEYLDISENRIKVVPDCLKNKKDLKIKR